MVEGRGASQGFLFHWYRPIIVEVKSSVLNSDQRIMSPTEFSVDFHGFSRLWRNHWPNTSSQDSATLDEGTGGDVSMGTRLFSTRVTRLTCRARASTPSGTRMWGRACCGTSWLRLGAPTVLIVRISSPGHLPAHLCAPSPGLHYLCFGLLQCIRHI